MGRSKGVRSAVTAPAPTPSLEPLLRPRSWQGVVYRPLHTSVRKVGRGAEGGAGDGARGAEGGAGDGARGAEGGAGDGARARVDEARALFAYVATWIPPAVPGELGWGAWVGEKGWEAEGRAGDGAREAEGGVGEYTGRLVGALVLEPHGAVGMIHGPVVVDQPDPFEVASQLVAATLPHATALGMHTFFTRPQGLDRVWIRFGFIPVPEAELPKVFRGRPGSGLFAWHGGSALWSSRRAGSDGLDAGR